MKLCRLVVAGLLALSLAGLSAPANAARQYSDIACETTTTTGTGTINLGGALSGGYLGIIASGITSGSTVPYHLETGTGGTRKIETGWSVITSGSPSTATRTVISSTDGLATALTLAGTSTFCVAPIANVLTLGGGSAVNADLLDGVDSTAFGLVASPLSQFAATTSSQLAGVISDETGSGALVFGTAPNIDTIELGNASDTTLSRVSAGVVAIEGVNIITTANTATTSTAGISQFATAAEYATGTSTTKALVVDQSWAAAAEVALSDATTIAFDMSTGINFSVTLAGNRTLGNPSNQTTGKCGYIAVGASTSPRTLAKGTHWLSVNITWPITITNGQTAYIFYCSRSSTVTLITGVINNPA